MTNKTNETLIVAHEEWAEQPLAAGIQELLTGFGEGDLDRVRSALRSLCATEDVALDSRILEMTREFHARMRVFKDSLSSSSITMTTTNIPDAARKLEDVMKLTNEATHNLFGMIDRFEQLLHHHHDAFEKFRIALEGVLPPDLSPFIVDYVQSHARYHQDAKALLSEMVISQEFQDLCGQSLAKILKLVKGVENEIGRLIKQFGIQVEAPTPPSPDEEAIAQESVDDILKQFEI